MTSLLLFLFASGPAAAAPAHPESLSSSLVTVEGARVRVELRCQTPSLVEALALDGDGDGALDAGELAAGRASVADYLVDRYRLYASYERAGETGERLPGRLTALELLDEGPAGTGAEAWIRAELAFEHARELEELYVRVRLFREQNPFHRDECKLVWNASEPARWLFAEGAELWHFDPDERPGERAFAAFFRQGLDHILAGLDHLAFLLALILAARGVRSLVGVVTAFTLAHSVTLALAALEVVRAPAHLVELAIALSIAYVAVLDLVARKPASRWLEAFVFGLIHGFGFASFFRELLFFEPSIAMPLVAFNLGVECGQLAVVAVAVIAIRFLPGERRSGDEPRAWLAPRWLRLGGAALVALAGLGWFAERAGWLPLA